MSCNAAPLLSQLVLVWAMLDRLEGVVVADSFLATAAPRVELSYLGHALAASSPPGSSALAQFGAFGGVDYWASDPWTRLPVFCRSFFLLQLLALLRLLWFAVPLRTGHKTVNGVVRRHRALLRGAPLALVFLACLPLVSAAPKRAFAQALATTDLSDITHDLDSPPAFGDSGRPPGLPGVLASTDMPPARNPNSPVFSRVRSQGWDVPVAVLGFQRLPMFTSVHSACVIDADDLADLAEEACDAHLGSLKFCPVHPQPHINYLVLLSFPLECDLLGRIPVCVQSHVLPVHDVDEQPRFWCEYFDTPLHFADVEAAFANEWLPGSKIYIGDACRLLTAVPHATQPGDPGDLVRVVRPGKCPPPAATVGAKLAAPDLHLRRLSVEGFPGGPDDPQRHCLLQPLEAPRMVQYAGLPGRCLLNEVLLSHARCLAPGSDP